MSMADLAYNQLPTIGYGPSDFSTRQKPRWDTANRGGPAPGSASLSANVGVGDLANVRAGVQVDTGAALRGALIGLAFLAALRVVWEAMDDD